MTGRPQPEATQRRARMLAPRISGASYAQIATAVGVPVASVGKDLARALDDQRRLNEAEDPWRPTLELARLDQAERACVAVLQNASAGGDHQVVLAATDRLLKIAERRAVIKQPEPVSGDELRQRRLAGGTR